MPVGAIAAAAQRIGVDGVVLSGFLEVAPAFWTDDLPNLVSAAACPVLLGGPLSLMHRRQIVQAGAVDLGVDLDLSFHRIREVFKSGSSPRSAWTMPKATAWGDRYR